jgi:hypothetical protein
VTLVSDPRNVLNGSNFTVNSANRNEKNIVVEHREKCVAIQSAIGPDWNNATLDSLVSEFERRTKSRCVFNG